MKSKYQNWLTDEGVEKIRGWVQSGLGRAEVAEKIGISPDTFTRWCRRFPKLAGLSGGAQTCEAVHCGGDNSGTAVRGAENGGADTNGAAYETRRRADRLVENALLKRAVGYTVQEITRQPSKDTGELEITKIVEKDVMPSTAAQVFWLKNRCGWDADGVQSEDCDECGGVVLLPPVDGE